MKHFENLTQAELLQLEDAVAQIAVLIAGADGHIDVIEADWAEKLTHIRTYSSTKDLHEFYEQVDANFSIKFNDLIKNLPKNTKERQQILSLELAKLNDIFPKLEAKVAGHLFESYVSYAKNIARSSGGILGFAPVSKDEAQWINLPMISPIEIIEPKEEEEEQK